MKYKIFYGFALKFKSQYVELEQLLILKIIKLDS